MTINKVFYHKPSKRYYYIVDVTPTKIIYRQYLYNYECFEAGLIHAKHERVATWGENIRLFDNTFTQDEADAFIKSILP